MFFVFWEIVAILESLAHQESVLWSPEQVPQIRVLLPASCKGLVGTLGPPRCQDHSRLKTLNSIIPVESLCWLRLHVHRSWDQNVDTLSDCGVFQNSTILQGNPWIHVAIAETVLSLKEVGVPGWSLVSEDWDQLLDC